MGKFTKKIGRKKQLDSEKELAGKILQIGKKIIKRFEI